MNMNKKNNNIIDLYIIRLTFTVIKNFLLFRLIRIIFKSESETTQMLQHCTLSDSYQCMSLNTSYSLSVLFIIIRLLLLDGYSCTMKNVYSTYSPKQHLPRMPTLNRSQRPFVQSSRLSTIPMHTMTPNIHKWKYKLHFKSTTYIVSDSYSTNYGSQYQSRSISYGFPYELFFKLTSQKPEIRLLHKIEPIIAQTTIPDPNHTTIPDPNQHNNPTNRDPYPSSSSTSTLVLERTPLRLSLPSESQTCTASSSSIDNSNNNKVQEEPNTSSSQEEPKKSSRQDEPYDSSSSTMNHFILSNNIYAWYILYGPCTYIALNLHREVEYRLKVKKYLLMCTNMVYSYKNALHTNIINNERYHPGINVGSGIRFKYNNDNVIKYNLSQWVPLTSRLSLLSGPTPNILLMSGTDTGSLTGSNLHYYPYLIGNSLLLNNIKQFSYIMKYHKNCTWDNVRSDQIVRDKVPFLRNVHDRDLYNSTNYFNIPFSSATMRRVGIGIALESPSPSQSSFMGYCSQIKSFQLAYAIKYSYYRDHRFLLFLLILYGFTIWIILAPDPLLNKPLALSSPDLKILIKCIEDTYINHVCSNHPAIHSPCDCGEPLNNLTREMFPQTSFDPLKVNTDTGKDIGMSKTIAVMVATMIISIALMESVSQNGVFIKL